MVAFEGALEAVDVAVGHGRGTTPGRRGFRREGACVGGR